MTRTVNRPPTQVHLPSDKQLGEKFFNHYNWKGICDDKNFLEVDQETFAYSENVYVDSESRLRSRPAVKFESKPTGLTASYNAQLIKAWTFNDIVFEQYKTHELDMDKTRLVFRKNCPLTGEVLATNSYAYTNKILKPILVDNYIFVFSDTTLYRYSIINKSLTASNDISVYIPNTKVISADNQEKELESKNVLTDKEIYTYLYNRDTGYSIDVLDKSVKVVINGIEYSVVFSENTPIVLTDKVNQFNGTYYTFISKLNGVAILNTSTNVVYFSANGGKTFDYLGEIPYPIHDLPKFSEDGYYITCVTQTDNTASATVNGIFIISALKDIADDELRTIYPMFTNLFDAMPTELVNLVKTSQFVSVKFETYNLFGGFARQVTTNNTTISYNNFIVDTTDSTHEIYLWSTDIGLASTAFPTQYGAFDRRDMACDFYKKDGHYIVSSAVTVLASKAAVGFAIRSIAAQDINTHLQNSNTVYNETLIDVYTYIDTKNVGVTLYNDYCALTMKHLSDVNYQYVVINYRTGDSLSVNVYCRVIGINCNAFTDNVIKNQNLSLGENLTDYIAKSYLSDDCTMIFLSSKTIYRLADIGTPIYLLNADDASINLTYVCGYSDSIYYIIATVNEQDVVTKIDLYTSNTDKTFELQYLKGTGYNIFIPDCNSQLSEVYLSKDNILYISEHKQNDDKQFTWYLPEINAQIMNYPITALHPISSTEMAIFNDREIWYVNYDTNLSGYVYVKSKLHVGVQQGSDIITTYDGTTVLFVCERGAVALTYQDFIASTEQKLTYISDTVYNLFKVWNVGPVKIYAYDLWIVFYKTTAKDCWVYDIRSNSWWYFKNFINNEQLLTVVTLDNSNKRYVPRLINDQGLYKLHIADVNYFDTDFNGKQYFINWNILSQKLYLGAVNYFKHVTNVTLNTAVDELNPVIMNYKMDIINYRHDMNVGVNNETFSFSINTIRTFVKRTNYMKVLEFQYALKSNENVQFINQRPLSLCAVTVRYKITGKVR